LTALTIRTSDPQNALARTSFHSPKSLSPHPPRIPSYHGQVSGLFRSFRCEQLRNSGNTFPHFGLDQFTPFLNLPGEHTLIRVLGKYGKKIDDLRSTDTLDNCLGERASANVYPCTHRYFVNQNI